MLDKLKNAFNTFIKKTLTEKKLENSIEDLRILLISNDVAMETADLICEKIINSFKGEQIGRLTSVRERLLTTLEEIISSILTPDKKNRSS